MVEEVVPTAVTGLTVLTAPRRVRGAAEVREEGRRKRGRRVTMTDRNLIKNPPPLVDVMVRKEMTVREAKVVVLLRKEVKGEGAREGKVVV